MEYPENYNTQISIILPTYNESKNIIEMLKQITNSLPQNIISQTIVVDDNSPDGTGKIVEEKVEVKEEPKNKNPFDYDIPVVEEVKHV